MACDPLNFLNIAHDLADSSDEAKNRTSIGRSYYAAYHQALNKKSKEDAEWIGGKGGVHEKLADSYV